MPQDLNGQNSRNVVMLRGRRRLFLLENGNLRNALPVPIGMPGGEPPTGLFEVLQKIPNPVWVHPVSGEQVEEQARLGALVGRLAADGARDEPERRGPRRRHGACGKWRCRPGEPCVQDDSLAWRG